MPHDLRAPLRHIDGLSRALLDDYADKLDKEGKEYLQFVREGAQKMGHLIDGLLKLSRAGRAKMHREPVDLSEMVRSIADAFQGEEPDRKVEFKIE